MATYILLILSSLFTLIKGKSMLDDRTTFILEMLTNSNPHSDNTSQIQATCNGQPTSLAETSKEFPVFVQSPEFPQNYPIDTWCIYDLEVPSNHKVIVKVLALEVDCPYDYVQFMTDIQPNVITLCPTWSALPEYYISPASVDYTFRIVFFSGMYVTYSGFWFNVYLEGPESSSPTTLASTTSLTTATTATSTTTTTMTSNGIFTNNNTAGFNTTSLFSTSTPTMSTSTPFTSTTTTTTTTTPTTTITTSTSTTTSSVTTTTTTSTTSTTAVAVGVPSASAICRCGKWLTKRKPGRIVGGSVAPAHSIPYQVGIWTVRGGSPFCGGTLISPNFVLTAAHCFKNKIASDLKIAVNDVNYQINDGEIFIGIKTIARHPSYNLSPQDNDFALLHLKSPAPISNNVNIACLPPDVIKTFIGTNMTISGWGYTSDGGSQSPNLKQAFVLGMSNNDCKATGYGNMITQNMICATTPNIDTDTCQGDSGGPMATTINGKVTLVGITSFGVGCAHAPYPGVYARVTAQKNWIIDNSDAGLCQN